MALQAAAVLLAHGKRRVFAELQNELSAGRSLVNDALFARTIVFACRLGVLAAGAVARFAALGLEFIAGRIEEHLRHLGGRKSAIPLFMALLTGTTSDVGGRGWLLSPGAGQEAKQARQRK